VDAGIRFSPSIRRNMVDNTAQIDEEMLQDIRDYDLAKQRIADGEEPIPSEITYAIIDGTNPIRVWRE
jgi:hypothetical protein